MLVFYYSSTRPWLSDPVEFGPPAPRLDPKNRPVLDNAGLKNVNTLSPYKLAAYATLRPPRPIPCRLQQTGK